MALRHLMVQPQFRGQTLLDRLNAQGFIAAYYLPDTASRATATGTFAGATVLEAGGRTALNMALTALPWGADGGLVYDGATSLGTISNDAALANLTGQAFAILVDLDTPGEQNGRLFQWGVAAVNVHSLGGAGSNRQIARIGSDTTDALRLTQNNEVDYLGAPAWVFMDYDDDDILGNGRRIRLHRAQDGVVTELVGGTDTALVGTVVNMVDDLIIGNDENAAWTIDGTVNKIVIFNGTAIATIDDIYADLTADEGV